MAATTLTYTAQTISWEGKYGSLTLKLGPLRSEPRLKRLAKISGGTAFSSSPAPTSFGEPRYKLAQACFHSLSGSICLYEWFPPTASPSYEKGSDTHPYFYFYMFLQPDFHVTLESITLELAFLGHVCVGEKL
uniref:Uncharacterized protein n=1 Tax=Rhizophora mucronata TaxID=61149 RepID=A0A2P2INZ9_RHIMU